MGLLMERRRRRGGVTFPTVVAMKLFLTVFIAQCNFVLSKD